MSTKREAVVNPDSCFNKADADEPIFILRANDPIAVLVVAYWATRAIPFHSADKINQAKEVAVEMERWYRDNAADAVPFFQRFQAPNFKELKCSRCGSTIQADGSCAHLPVRQG